MAAPEPGICDLGYTFLAIGPEMASMKSVRAMPCFLGIIELSGLNTHVLASCEHVTKDHGLIIMARFVEGQCAFMIYGLHSRKGLRFRLARTARFRERTF